MVEWEMHILTCKIMLDITKQLKYLHANNWNNSLICRFPFCKFLCTWKSSFMQPAVCVYRHCLSSILLHIYGLRSVFDKLQQALNSHVVCLDGQMSEVDGLSEPNLCHSIKWTQKSLITDVTLYRYWMHPHDPLYNINILKSQQKAFPNRPTATNM